MKTVLKIAISSVLVWGILFALDAVAQTEPPDLDTSELLPETLTDEGEADTFPIREVSLPSDLQKEGSTTTLLFNIDEPEAVEDLTFDDVDVGRVVFKEEVDLTSDTAVNQIENIGDHISFDELEITVSTALYNTLDSAIEISFYDIPFVWEPKVTRNDSVLGDDELSNFKLKVENGKDAVSFIARKGGAYGLVPRLDLLFENEQVVKKEDFTILGRISDPEAKVSLNLNTNDIPSEDITIDPKTGQFTATASLLSGSNLVVATAESEYGEVTDASKLVFFEERTTPMRDGDGINPLIYLAIALIVITLLFILASKLSKRR